MGGLHRPFMPRKPLDALQGPDAGEQLPGRTCSSRRLPCGERGVWGGAPGFDCERSPLQDIAVPEYQNIKSGDHTHSTLKGARVHVDDGGGRVRKVLAEEAVSRGHSVHGGSRFEDWEARDPATGVLIVWQEQHREGER